MTTKEVRSVSLQCAEITPFGIWCELDDILDDVNKLKERVTESKDASERFYYAYEKMRRTVLDTLNRITLSRSQRHKRSHINLPPSPGSEHYSGECYD